MIAAKRIEADLCVVERLGRSGSNRHIAPSAVAVKRVVFHVNQVADLNHEFDAVLDELLVVERLADARA